MSSAGAGGAAAAAEGMTCVTNGRFVGGHITRAYGQPASGVHAIQMELAQDRYMDEEAPPFAYRPDRAEKLQRVLTAVLDLARAVKHRAGMGFFRDRRPELYGRICRDE